jgi:hypothetical protein
MNNHLLFTAKPISFRLEAHFFSLSFLFCLLAILIFSNSVSAQTVKWQYVATLGRNTVKVYLNDEVKVLANKNVSIWHKMIEIDGTYTISQEEFDCKNKRRITRQITYYRTDQTAIETKKKSFEWQEIIPSSTGDFLYRRVCLPPQPEKWAEISVRQANLRNFPDPYAAVLRIAGRGEKFQIVPETGNEGWFNIVDVSTQKDYWLQDNSFEIVQIVPIKQQPVRKENLQSTPVIQKPKAKQSKNQRN